MGRKKNHNPRVINRSQDVDTKRTYKSETVFSITDENLFTGIQKNKHDSDQRRSCMQGGYASHVSLVWWKFVNTLPYFSLRICTKTIYTYLINVKYYLVHYGSMPPPPPSNDEKRQRTKRKKLKEMEKETFTNRTFLTFLYSVNLILHVSCVFHQFAVHLC